MARQLLVEMDQQNSGGLDQKRAGPARRVDQSAMAQAVLISVPVGELKSQSDEFIWRVEASETLALFRWQVVLVDVVPDVNVDTLEVVAVQRVKGVFEG